MNKAELIEALAKSHFQGNKAQAGRALNAVIGTITTELARTDKVSITGFGVFEKQHKEERTVRNPRTGDRKLAPAVTVARFRPGSELKAVVAAGPLPKATRPVAASTKPEGEGR